VLLDVAMNYLIQQNNALNIFFSGFEHPQREDHVSDPEGSSAAGQVWRFHRPSSYSILPTTLANFQSLQK